jgi:hypothetical protein
LTSNVLFSRLAKRGHTMTKDEEAVQNIAPLRGLGRRDGAP